MVSNITLCIYTTYSGTGIHTVQPLASLVWWTVRVDNTFRSTGYVWIPKVFRYTLASSCSVTVVTHCVWSTGWGVAGINYLCDCWWWGSFPATWCKGVPFITWITSTDRIMILYRTGCMYTTHTWTGINTLLVNTSLCWGTLLVNCTFRFAFNVRVSKQAR